MKKFLAASTVLVGLVTGTNSALAADPFVESTYDWTGFYLGAQIGYAWQDESVTLTPNGGAPYNTTDVNPEGFLGGINAGYNWQTSNIVFGIEGDIELKDVDETYNIGAPFANTTGTSESDFQGSIRGRLGFAMDRTLFYGTGGITIAHFEDTFSTPPAFFDSPSSTRVGWTAGGGIEHAFMDHWTARLEYRYTDFGKHKDDLNNFLAPPGFSTDDVTEQSVRFAIDFKL